MFIFDSLYSKEGFAILFDYISVNGHFFHVFLPAEHESTVQIWLSRHDSQKNAVKFAQVAFFKLLSQNVTREYQALRSTKRNKKNCIPPYSLIVRFATLEWSFRIYQF